MYSDDTSSAPPPNRTSVDDHELEFEHDVVLVHRLSYLPGGETRPSCAPWLALSPKRLPPVKRSPPPIQGSATNEPPIPHGKENHDMITARRRGRPSRNVPTAPMPPAENVPPTLARLRVLLRDFTSRAPVTVAQTTKTECTDADVGLPDDSMAQETAERFLRAAIGYRLKQDQRAKIEAAMRAALNVDHRTIAVEVWCARGDNHHGRIVRLLILIGQRRDEIGDMALSEVNGATLKLPGSRMKNRRPRDVPLSSLALDVISAGPVRLGQDFLFETRANGFSGWSKAKAELDARIIANEGSVRPWTLHDLRSTAATGMASIGVLPHVVEAVLNHVSGHKAGIAGIYNRHSYAAEKRAALDMWANRIGEIVQP